MSKTGSRKDFRLLFVLVLFLIGSAPSYKSVLKEWTRKDKVHTFENMELKVQWHATYLSSPFRGIRRERLAGLLDWSEEERAGQEALDLREAASFDEFFVGIYAGSSAEPGFGKDTGLWRISLGVGGREVRPILFERVRVTDIERSLYPYLDKWTHAYRIRFKKSVRDGEPFALRMMGIPAKSELVWE